MDPWKESGPLNGHAKAVSFTTLDRPILVTGGSRCGKGRVVNILGSSPEFHHFHEPLPLWRPFEGEDDTRSAAQATDGVKSRMRRQINAEICAAGKQRYLDDFAFHLLWIPFALEILPEARVIHVVRNGEKVIPETYYAWTHTEPVLAAVRHRKDLLTWHSLPQLPRLVARAMWNKVVQSTQGARRTMGPRVPGMTAFRKCHSMPELAAYQWQMLVEIGMDALEKLPPDRWMIVRFEDLFTDLDREVERLISFAELVNPAAARAAAPRLIDPEYVPPLRREPSEEEWAKARALIAPTQRRLGYMS